MILIRAAESKDIPCLKKLFLQLGYQTDTESLEQRICDAQSTLCTLVAESEQEVCGVVVINFITPVHENSLWALISALVIDESSRGAGIGQQLLIASERIALDKKCSQIELSSSERRTRAHKKGRGLRLKSPVKTENKKVRLRPPLHKTRPERVFSAPFEGSDEMNGEFGQSELPCSQFPL